MNRKQLADSIFRNWPAKIICLTIAIFLYLFYQASLVDKKTFVIPLTVVENGLVMHVGEIPSSVVVSVRASENDVKAIFATDMKATIDLSNYVESGTYKVPVEVIISDKLKGIDPLELKLKEEKLVINVEKRVGKYVPVVPSIVGDVAENYEIESVSMNPSSVKIEGPESLVNAISEVTTAKVNVSNAKTNFTAETTYNKLCNLVKIADSYVSKATIVVVPKVEEREYVSVPLKVINLAENLQIVGELPKYSIKLKGEIPSFKKYDISKNPIILDLAEIRRPGIYEVPVRFTIPFDFELVDDSGDSITVSIEEKIVEKLENDSEEGEADENNNDKLKDEDDNTKTQNDINGSSNAVKNEDKPKNSLFNFSGKNEKI